MRSELTSLGSQEVRNESVMVEFGGVMIWAKVLLSLISNQEDGQEFENE